MSIKDSIYASEQQVKDFSFDQNVQSFEGDNFASFLPDLAKEWHFFRVLAKIGFCGQGRLIKIKRYS